MGIRGDGGTWGRTRCMEESKGVGENEEEREEGKRSLWQDRRRGEGMEEGRRGEEKKRGEETREEDKVKGKGKEGTGMMKNK